jgi:hypothetical protein
MIPALFARKRTTRMPYIKSMAPGDLTITLSRVGSFRAGAMETKIRILKLSILLAALLGAMAPASGRMLRGGCGGGGCLRWRNNDHLFGSEFWRRQRRQGHCRWCG